MGFSYGVVYEIYSLLQTPRLFLSLFSIKSNLFKLDTALKVYSVNKGLFIGVLSSPWFAYVGRSRNWLAIYREIFYDLRYPLAIKTDAIVHLYYYSFLPGTH